MPPSEESEPARKIRTEVQVRMDGMPSHSPHKHKLQIAKSTHDKMFIKKICLIALFAHETCKVAAVDTTHQSTPLILFFVQVTMRVVEMCS